MMDAGTATAPQYYGSPEQDSLLSAANPSGGTLSISQKLRARQGRQSTNTTNQSQNQTQNNYENAPMGGAAPLATSSISKTLLGA